MRILKSKYDHSITKLFTRCFLIQKNTYQFVKNCAVLLYKELPTMMTLKPEKLFEKNWQGMVRRSMKKQAHGTKVLYAYSMRSLMV
jgi:hypothetical protein